MTHVGLSTLRNLPLPSVLAGVQGSKTTQEVGFDMCEFEGTHTSLPIWKALKAAFIF